MALKRGELGAPRARTAHRGYKGQGLIRPLKGLIRHLKGLKALKGPYIRPLRCLIRPFKVLIRPLKVRC